MADSPVIAIGLTYRDRGGNRAKCTTYCAWATPIAAVWDLANAFRSAIAPLTSAQLVKIEITYRHTIDDQADDQADADLERRVLFLVENADGMINAVLIPAPREMWEISGPYAGIRVDLLSTSAIAFVELIQAIELRTRDGGDFGNNLVVGGLAL